MCPIHLLSPLDKVCLTDQVLICDSCHCEDHFSDNHDVRKVENVSGNIRDIIESKLKALEFMEAVMKMNENDSKQHHQDVNESAEKSLSEIDRIFDIIAKQVEDRRLELKEQVDIFKQAQFDHCKEIESHLSQSQSLIATTRESINQKLPNDFQLLKSTEDIDNQLNEVEKKLREFLDMGPSLMNLKVQFDESIIQDQISSYGCLEQGTVDFENEKKLTVLNEVQELVDNNTIDQQDEYGETYLMGAAEEGDYIKVEILIKFQANVHLTYNDESTALHWAGLDGHVKCLDILLKAGSEPNAADKDGDTPLLWAARKGQHRCIKALLAAGADKNASAADGFTPLHWVALENYEDCVKLLVEAGADMEKMNNYGNAPLHLAASNGHEKCVELLLGTGADIETTDSDRAPLHFAAGNGHEKCVELLLGAGADMEKTDSEGDASLHFAAANGHEKCLRLLLDAGADRLIRNRAGKTPLEIATDEECRALLRA